MISLLSAALCLTTHPVLNEVPFRIGDDAIIVDVSINGKSASLMYDTGFSGTVVMGDSIDLGKATGSQMLTDFVGSFEAKTVAIKSLKIGDRPMPGDDMVAIQQPTEHYTMAYGTHCDGILGFQPFGKSVFEINFQHNKFIFHPDTLDLSQRKPDGVKTFMAKLYPKGINSLELGVDMANGEKLHMALDTGNAGYAVTHKDALERVKVWPEGKKANFMGQSVVASGPVDTFKLAMNDIKIFGVPVKRCIFGVIDLPAATADHDGTIGFGFLKNFNITIDMVRRRVFFENWSGRVTDDEQAEIGMMAFVDPKVKRMRVYTVTPGGPAEKLGIKRGDDLLAVNGEDIGTKGFRYVDALLKGAPGTKVKLDLSRGGQLMRVEAERAILVNES